MDIREQEIAIDYGRTRQTGNGSALLGGPREKARDRGIQYLSNQELVMMMIGSGSPRNPVENLAAQALPVILRGLPGVLEPRHLQTIKGIGNAKASVMSASMELARRCYAPSGKKITNPCDAFALLSHYASTKQEHFLCMALNGAHEVLGTFVVSIGLVNRTLVHPREVFAPALETRAAAILVAHNHPSGNLQPSQEDRDVTRRLKEAGEILGIPVLDHLIFSAGEYASLLELGDF
ncbi:MAG: DNA repair protein RadC [Spirochaetales bacterium]|nr:DNA repair protein RadC [Spirochaetales bacterium]